MSRFEVKNVRNWLDKPGFKVYDNAGKSFEFAFYSKLNNANEVAKRLNEKRMTYEDYNNLFVKQERTNNGKENS